MEVVLIFLGLIVLMFVWLVLVYMSKFSQLSAQVAQLKAQVRTQASSLEALLQSQQPAPPSAARTTSPEAMAPLPPQPVAAPPPAPAPSEASPDRPRPARPGAVELDRPTKQGPSAFQRWIQHLRGTDEWEALIGGRLFNRIGAFALILGIAFFFKYAVDQNWISQTMRVGIGIFVGGGLLALAARSHVRGYAIFAQGLVGAGLATLYVSVYASFNFYHLVSQPVALTGMGLVTILAFVQALYYDSIAVSLLACIGGYLTPLILSSPPSGPIGTVIYVFLLDIGVLAVSIRKRSWLALEPIALGATYIIYLTWYLGSYRSSQLLMAAIAISAFWSLFFAFDVYTLLTTESTTPRLRHIVGLVNGASFYVALFALVESDHRTLMSLLTLAIGAAYVAALMVVRWRGRLSDGVAARYALTALVLLVVATAIQFSGFILVILWSLEAAPLMWYGVRSTRRYVWCPAVVLFALATTWLFATPNALAYLSVAHFRPLVNQRTLAYLVLTAALASSTVRGGRLRRDKGKPLETFLHSWWIVLFFILLAVETNDLFRSLMLDASQLSRLGLQFTRSLAIATIWMAYSLPLVWFGFRGKVLPMIVGGLGSAALGLGLGAVVGITYQPIERFSPVLNVRAAALVLLIIALAVHLRWLTERRSALPWTEAVRAAVQAAIVLTGFELISAEINDYFMHRIGHPLTSMDTGSAFIELAIFGAVWMLYSLLPTWYGIHRRHMALLMVGLSMTAGAIVVGAFAGIVFQPTNQFALMLGVRPFILTILATGLLVQLRWLRASGVELPWSGNAIVVFQAAIILLGFGLISAETRDVFSRQIALLHGSSSTGIRDLERLAFSAIWLAYAMLVVVAGIWRREQWMRVAAMALFAFVILKVFIYDLAFLAPGLRPISFAALGVILLAVSYLYHRYRSLLLDAA